MASPTKLLFVNTGCWFAAEDSAINCDPALRVCRPVNLFQEERKQGNFYALIHDASFTVPLVKGPKARVISSMFASTEDRSAIRYDDPSEPRLPDREKTAGDHGPLIAAMRMLLMIRFGFLTTTQLGKDLRALAYQQRVHSLAMLL